VDGRKEENMTSLASGANWLQRHKARLWAALRMTTSATVTFAAGTLLDMPQSFWAVIAALIVTQSNIGGSLKAGLEQFTGSVLGAAWGAAIALTIPHETVLTRGGALVLAVAPLALLPTFSPGFRIAPITAILVLLSSMGIEMGPLSFALERVMEVAMGCAVGLCVSLLIVPAHAYDGVLRAAGNVAGMLADQLELLADVWDHPEKDMHALPNQIRGGLARLEALAQEASRERRSHLANEPDPEPLWRTLARLSTDVSALGRILADPLPEEVHERLSEPWSAFARSAATILRKESQVFADRKAPPEMTPVIEAIATYTAAVDRVRREGVTRNMSHDAVARVFALGFVLDQFRRNLQDLIDRTAEVRRAAKAD
jgi:uncharacterized membrane protein YccC